MNIALTGFMGTGKTTVGKILAENMQMDFMETDSIIELRTGKKIPEIFRDNGEEAFREIEKMVIKEVAENKNLIVSCGGGVVTDQENVEQLKKRGKIILLNAKEETVINRVANSTDRPLLNTEDWQDRVHELMSKRLPMYKKAADIEVDTDELTPAEVAEKIKSKLAHK